MKNAENLSFLSGNGTPSLAVVPAATPDGWDEMSAVTGRVFVAQNPEQFTYDADGNISEYVSESGEIVAHYDYSPFGETLIESGDLASSFTHRFSTKPWCPVTGLYEYQMRKYRPEMGRWMSRDPMGVDKGVNELSFLGNNSIGLSDYLGLKPSDGGRRKTKPCECGDDELNKVALLAIDAGIKDMKAKNDGLERCGRLCCRKETGEIKFTKRVGNTNTKENREQCPPDRSPVCAIFGKEYMLVGYYHTHPASPNFGDNDRDWIKAKNVPFFVGIGDGKGKRLDPADKINPHVTVPPRVPAEPIETIIPWPNDKERK